MKQTVITNTSFTVNPYEDGSFSLQLQEQGTGDTTLIPLPAEAASHIIELLTPLAEQNAKPKIEAVPATALHALPPLDESS